MRSSLSLRSLLVIALVDAACGSLRGAGKSDPGATVQNVSMRPTLKAQSGWNIFDNDALDCDYGTSPGQESPNGWDPCCANTDECNIFDAVWDPDKNPTGDEVTGGWCHTDDYINNGHSCWNGESYDFWTGGFIYDWFGDDGDIQKCVPTVNDDGVFDWQFCWEWSGDPDCWKNYFAEHEDSATEVCYNAFIRCPYKWDGTTGGCDSFDGVPYYSVTNEVDGREMCYPGW